MQTQRISIRAYLVILAVWAFLGAVVGTGEVQAQEPCIVGCDTVAYSSNFDTTIELPNGCWVRVTYAFRYACDNWDIGIVSIEPRSPQCSSMNLHALLKQTSKALLEDLWFPYLLPDSCVTYRLIKGSCWHYDTNACGHTIALPCDSTPCCVTDYEVCMDSTGHRTATITGQPSSNLNCDSVSTGCVNVCSDDTTMVNPGGGGSSKYNRRMSNDIGSEVGSIRPNPTNGKTTIEYRVSEATDIVLTVHSADGQKVARLIEGHRAPGVYSVEFDASGLASGTYFYRLHTPRGTATGTIVVER